MTLQIPGPSIALCQQFGISGLETVSLLLKALTSLGNGDGQLLVYDNEKFITILSARRGELNERSIGRTVSASEEPFAYKARLRQHFVTAPIGLVSDKEPVQHGAATVLVGKERLVLTLDLPLAEIHFSSWWKFPRSLVRKICQDLWKDVIPNNVLTWILQGREDIAIWDERKKLRWTTTGKINCPDLSHGLTINNEFTALQSTEGTIVRYHRPTSPLIYGYALIRSEVHHRVKNDLQSVVSWLNIQAKQTAGEAKSILLEASDRVKTFALVHDLLAKARGEFVALREVIHQLTQAITQQTQQDKKQVNFVVVGPEINLSPKQASSIVPALHELLRNAYQHAFDLGEIGTVTVRIQNHETKFCVEIVDNGKGFDMKTIGSNSLGITIAKNLIEQNLKGQMKIRSEVGKGTTVCIHIPIET